MYICLLTRSPTPQIPCSTDRNLTIQKQKNGTLNIYVVAEKMEGKRQYLSPSYDEKQADELTLLRDN
jgi:hypothetical protein